MTLSIYDALLLVSVSTIGTLLAYIYEPRWKAFLLTLPIPFTLATLAVGRPLDATNVLGLVVLLLFTQGVRLLHSHARLPIVPSIVIPAVGYCLAGTALAGVLPATDAAFWPAWEGVLVLAAILYVTTPHREEPGHRSPLPVYIKLPAIALVISALIVIKHSLNGFTTVFPMVGVVAAYEARHSLWTICRQIPVLILTLLPMMATMRIVEKHSGLPASLIAGWAVFLPVLLAFTWRLWWTPAKTNLEVLGNDRTRTL